MGCSTADSLVVCSEMELVHNSGFLKAFAELSW